MTNVITAKYWTKVNWHITTSSFYVKRRNTFIPKYKQTWIFFPKEKLDVIDATNSVWWAVLKPNPPSFLASSKEVNKDQERYVVDTGYPHLESESAQFRPHKNIEPTHLSFLDVNPRCQRNLLNLITSSRSLI